MGIGRLSYGFRGGLLALAGLIAACGAAPAAPAAGTDRLPSLVAPAMEARASDFAGSCAWGRGPGSADDYRSQVRVRVPSAPVFATPRLGGWNEQPIGLVRRGATLWASGPLQHGRYDFGLAFAILVRGVHGRVCRGYVRAAEVEVQLQAR